MKSLLKYDFKKIFFSKATLITNFIILILLLISFTIFLSSLNLPTITLKDLSNFNSQVFSFDNIYMFFAIALSYLLVREYSDHTVRNKIITGHSKKKIFLSKIIIGVAYLFILFTFYYFLLLGIEVLIAYGKGTFKYIPKEFADVLKYHILQLFIAVLVVVIAAYFSMIIQKVSVNIIAIVGLFIGSQLLLLFTVFFETNKIILLNIKYLLPKFYSLKIFEGTSLLGRILELKQDPFLLGILVTSIYIIIFLVLGIFTVEKRSVK